MREESKTLFVSNPLPCLLGLDRALLLNLNSGDEEKVGRKEVGSGRERGFLPVETVLKNLSWLWCGWVCVLEFFFQNGELGVTISLTMECLRLTWEWDRKGNEPAREQTGGGRERAWGVCLIIGALL